MKALRLNGGVETSNVQGCGRLRNLSLPGCQFQRIFWLLIMR
jgi:hypothetical protein